MRMVEAKMKDEDGEDDEVPLFNLATAKVKEQWKEMKQKATETVPPAQIWTAPPVPPVRAPPVPPVPPVPPATELPGFSAVAERQHHGYTDDASDRGARQLPVERCRYQDIRYQYSRTPGSSLAESDHIVPPRQQIHTEAQRPRPNSHAAQDSIGGAARATSRFDTDDEVEGFFYNAWYPAKVKPWRGGSLTFIAKMRRELTIQASRAKCTSGKIQEDLRVVAGAKWSKPTIWNLVIFPPCSTLRTLSSLRHGMSGKLARKVLGGA